MKIYKDQKSIEEDIKDGVLEIKGDVRFECSFSISASIKVIAGDINAGNINAGNISAGDINAGEIIYYAFCCVYKSIKCLSIKARREKHQKPVCLDGSITIKKK
jgi:hypothetical protein